MASKPRRKLAKQQVRRGGNASHSKPTRRQAKRAPRKSVSLPRRGWTASDTATEVRSAVKNLQESIRKCELAGNALLHIAASIESAGVNTFRTRLAHSLVAEHILQDLSDARGEIAAVRGEPIPASLRQFSLLPQALLDWIERNLTIKPYPRLGQEMEIPRESLADFSVVGEISGKLPDLVRICIKSQGWRSGTETIIKPTIIVLETEGPEARK